MELTERTIQNAIYSSQLSGMKIMVPNYTPERWFECGVFGVTNAGYFMEFEIKLTRSDFAKDRYKRASGPVRSREDRHFWEPCDGRTKHCRIEAGDIDGPARFYYVYPFDMFADDGAVPPWAGIIHVHDASNYLELKIKRSAPKIHGEKVLGGIIYHARSVCYYRYWNERSRPK